MVAAVATLALAAGVWLAAHRQDSAAPSTSGPAAAERTALDTLRSQALTGPNEAIWRLGQPGSGRLVVINFWATWCAPCVDEIPRLSELHSKVLADGVDFVGIGIDSAANIAKFVQNQPTSYPLVGIGAGGLDLVRHLGDDSGGLPFTVVIGRDGRVARRFIGEVDVSELAQWLSDNRPSNATSSPK